MIKKKLIEVALPLDKINEASVREKSIRHGHPSTLHLWWSRKPLATARAVIWASLVDDPSSHPEQFPTEEAQNKERQRLFSILEKLVIWENSNNKEVLDAAKKEIWNSTNSNPPEFLDPFAGGGAIPLEGQRLGLKVHAHDLNPVAVMINKAMIEIPPKFAGQPPVNPEARSSIGNNENWPGATGLAEDVRYYGEWMRNEAYKRIGYLYPKVKVPNEQGGGEATVIAWIWTRTVKCPNPACGCEMPLASTFVLSKKKGKEAWVQPEFVNGHFKFTVHYGPYDKKIEEGTKKGKKAQFICPHCKAGLVDGNYADSEANHKRMGSLPLAIVAEGKKKRIYLSPDSAVIQNWQNEVENYYISHQIENQVSHAKCRGTFASNAQGRRYGFFEFKDYFTHRQLIMLATFSSLVKEAQQKAEAAAVEAGLNNDHLGLNDSGTGAKAYGEAVGVYLAFLIDRLSDRGSMGCSWDTGYTKIRNTFGRQAISIIWNYAEGNPFSNSTGSFQSMIKWVTECLKACPANTLSEASQVDAQNDCGLRNLMISTDPPYYDNVSYADLSDFFYVWLRQSLNDTYPDIFSTLLVPKAKELIATPYRHEGNENEAKNFFENGMLQACQQIYQYVREDIPVTIYYAYKQSDSQAEGAISSGWETMLNAIIHAGFSITGTWPIRTELMNRSNAFKSNSLASSIVLVCRKRPRNAPQTTRRRFVAELRRELHPALKELQQSNIAPVDLAQSAIGPGMSVFSKYRCVLESDGTPMNVRSAQSLINEELDSYFNEQVGSLDTASRFCVDIYMQCAYNDMNFGEAEVLANAKNVSIPSLVHDGVLYAKAGKVHLVEREELPVTMNIGERNIWLLTQQLAHTMQKEGVEGCAKKIAPMYGSNTEDAKDLAYRLYTIAEQKKWTDEAYAYNALVVAWPDIQTRAAELKAEQPEMINLFE